MIEELLGILWALIVIIIVLALAYLFTKHVVGRVPLGVSGRKKQHMSVVERIVIGRDQQILLVRVGKKMFFLGAAEGGVTCLKEMSDEEWQTLSDSEDDADDTAPMGFKEALQKVMEQRKQKGGD